MPARGREEVAAALRIVREADASDSEKAEMLMEVATNLQTKPRTPDEIDAAIDLYRAAIDVCPSGNALLSARIRARLGTALMASPTGGADALAEARDELTDALAVLSAQAGPEEVAEAEMNLGLALQSLAGAGRAPIKDAIGAYQRALRAFDRARHPKEYAILQNNLATAFLSVSFADPGSRMREALAVQAFEEGLSAVALVDHPSEYAMLQNNLGNALQSVSSGHPVENGFRAIEAYREALKVRNARDMPREYANTVANMANCLAGLPDDPADETSGNAANLREARSLLGEALAIFRAHGETDKASEVASVLAAIDADLEATNPAAAVRH